MRLAALALRRSLPLSASCADLQHSTQVPWYLDTLVQLVTFSKIPPSDRYHEWRFLNPDMRLAICTDEAPVPEPFPFCTEVLP